MKMTFKKQILFLEPDSGTDAEENTEDKASKPQQEKRMEQPEDINAEAAEVKKDK